MEKLVFILISMRRLPLYLQFRTTFSCIVNPWGENNLVDDLAKLGSSLKKLFDDNIVVVKLFWLSLENLSKMDTLIMNLEWASKSGFITGNNEKAKKKKSEQLLLGNSKRNFNKNPTLIHVLDSVYKLPTGFRKWIGQKWLSNTNLGPVRDGSSNFQCWSYFAFMSYICKMIK